MGVGVPVGIDVGKGVEVAVGARVTIGRGVTFGWGGGLTHAASPIDQRISQDHFATFTTCTCLPKKDCLYLWVDFRFSNVTCSTPATYFSGAVFGVPAALLK